MADFNSDKVAVMGLVIFAALTSAVVGSFSPEVKVSEAKPKFIFDVPVNDSWDFSREVVEYLRMNPIVDSEYKREWCKLSADCRKMSEALVYEARGEGVVGLTAVAQVIKNRADGDNRFPNTVVGVITQRSQFSYLQDMHKQLKPSQDSWTTARIVSYDILNGVTGSFVGEATHYHSMKVVPYWSKHLKYVAVVGNHKFYLE